jgi:ABC-type branched-subunit amino acid transport system ATPase component
MGIVLVEQYFDFAFKLSDYTYAMERGKFLAQGITSPLDKKKLKGIVSI